ncbi:MAG: acyl-ACP--UDP-N-acetylglucosamine O-acyltransferase [Chthoniobacterales bacterium]
MKVHPTAAVDPAASIGREVEIGAFALIGPEAVIGDECVIQSHVVIEGEVRLGRQNRVGSGSILGGPPQDLGFKEATRSRVEIGDGNIIREHCTIHRGTTADSATTVGDGNFLMAGVHIGHNCQIGGGVIIANNCLLGGYVRIGDRAFLGGGTVFHQYTRVGRMVITQGNSGFGKDIPPFVVAAQRNEIVGLNVVGLRRAGLTPEERDEVKRAFKLLYRSGLNTRQALERAADVKWGPLGREFFDFVAAAGSRGIVPSRRASPHEED